MGSSPPPRLFENRADQMEKSQKCWLDGHRWPPMTCQIWSRPSRRMSCIGTCGMDIVACAALDSLDHNFIWAWGISILCCSYTHLSGLIPVKIFKTNLISGAFLDSCLVQVLLWALCSIDGTLMYVFQDALVWRFWRSRVPMMLPFCSARSSINSPMRNILNSWHTVESVSGGAWDFQIYTEIPLKVGMETHL